ncbi:10433_t:CDS:2, partial [Dentiscutata heterogama]
PIIPAKKRALQKVKKERMDTLNDLKEKTHQDDISHLLILNKKTQNIEPQLFATELEKFSPYRNRITSSIHHQQALLEELTVFYKNLVGGEEARILQDRWEQAERRKKEVCERLKKAKDNYLEVKDGLRKGIQFYVDLNDLIENLSKTVHQFARTRQQEREDLIQSIQNQEELRIKSQMNKLNVANVTMPNTRSISYDTSAHLSEELNKLSLNAGVPGTNIYTANNTSQEASAANVPANISTFYDNTIPSTVQSFSVQESYPAPSAPSQVSSSAQSHISPSAPSHISPSAPSHISPSAPSHISPSAPSYISPSAPSHVNSSAPSHVNPSAPSHVNPSAPSHVNPSAPSHVSPSAPSCVSPSAPPPITVPGSPTSHNPYYSQTPQRIVTQSSIGYSMQPMSPKTQGPPVPPLPTEYQQNSVYIPFQSDIQRSYQPIVHSMSSQSVTPQQQSLSRPSSIYGTSLPSQPNYSQTNHRYSQQQPPQQLPQLPAQHRQSTYDSFASPLQSGYIPPPSGLHQSQVPPAQQQYSSPVPVAQPQQYNVQTMQRPQFSQPPQMLPTQQPQNFYQTNPIPSQVQQPAVGYYHNSAQPVPIQQGNYPPTTGPQQPSHGYQQAPYHTQYRPPTAPPSGNDGPSLLD